MSRMDVEKELKGSDSARGWQEVWTSGEFAGVIDTVKSTSPSDYLPASMTALCDLLNSRSFQVTLSLKFDQFLDFQHRLFSLLSDVPDISPIESFVNRALQHPAHPVFLYGLIWLKDLLWSGSDANRVTFLTQAKHALCQSVSIPHTSTGGGHNPIGRYAQMVAVAARTVEIEATFEEFAHRREYAPLVCLCEFTPVSEAMFQKLTLQLSQNSPPEQFSAIFTAIQYHSRGIFPQTLAGVTPAALSFVSKLWKGYQGRPVPLQFLRPLISYVRVKPLMPVSPDMRENETKAAVAALALIGTTAESGISASLWLDISETITALKDIEAETRQKMVAIIGKIIAVGLRYDNGAVYISILRALRAFVESADNVNISGLIPQSALPAVLSFCDSGVVESLDTTDLTRMLERYTAVEEPRRTLDWGEVAIAVARLQTAVGLPTALQGPGNRSESIVKTEVVKALEDVKRLISA